MIEDLRFVEKVTREAMIDVDGNNYIPPEKKRILQAYDGHVWFDVPFVEDSTQ